MCPELWKEFKMIPLSKDGNGGFTGSNSLMILEGIIFKHILNCFSRNGLLASAQHAYRPGHPISTALVHISDQWLSHRDDRTYWSYCLHDGRWHCQFSKMLRICFFLSYDQSSSVNCLVKSGVLFGCLVRWCRQANCTEQSSQISSSLSIRM